MESDAWEIGAFIFACIKGSPPYNNKSKTDMHYNSLKNGQFDKFWNLIR